MATDLRLATPEVNLSLTWQIYQAKAAQSSDPVINELQHMRGRVAYANGRRPRFMNDDGHLCDPCPLDSLCHHVFVRAQSQLIGSCRLLEPAQSGITGIEAEIGTESYEQALSEIAVSRQHVAEASRWIVMPEYAALSLGLRIIAGIWALSQALKIQVVMAIAGTAMGQANALIRTGAKPIKSFKPFFSSKYDEELVLLYFEIARPASRFRPLIEQMRSTLQLKLYPKS